MSRPGRLAALALVMAGLLAYAQPENFEAMRALLDEGRYALAVQVEGPRLVTAFPEEAEAYYLYSRALYLVGDLVEAGVQLEEAIARDGGEPRYRWLEALLEADGGRPQAAQERLERLFSAAPSYALAMDWGRVAWQAGDFDSAIRAFTEAQVREGGRYQPWPYLNHARLLGYQGRFEEAIDVLQTAIDVIVAAEDTAEDTAENAAENATENAAPRNDEAAVPHPAYVEAFYLLGEAYEALGQREDARANYYAALSADPIHQPSRIALNRLEDEGP
jgi:tetratricopeptide (TPR) repeat protein